MSRHSHFIIGVSIGTGIEPTALAVVEQIIDSGGNWLAKTRALELRHLERLPAQTSYPEMVECVATLLSSAEIDEGEGCGEAAVMLDVTASGRAICELFKRANIRFVTVNITSAGVLEEEVKFDDWRLPKVELVGALRVAYEAERLRMARSLELVPDLLNELREFKMKPPRIDANDPESWRENEFDDLVFAVGLATWRASRVVPSPDEVRGRYDKRRQHRAKSWMSA